MARQPVDAPATNREEVRREAEFVADWVIDFVGPSYGPHGGHKMFDGEPITWTRSGASALRDLPTMHPGLQPYQDLARQVQAHGDHATGAVLLAAHLVKRCIQLKPSDGLHLAKRQALGWLAANTVDHACLDDIVAQPWAAYVYDGLVAMAEQSSLNLDDVHIVAADGPVWGNGLQLDAPAVKMGTGNVAVLLIKQGPQQPRTAASMTIRTPQSMVETHDDAFIERVETLGAGLVACATNLSEELRARLAQRGILALHQVPKDMQRRLATATAGTWVHDVGRASAADLGTCDLQRLPHRTGGWQLSGPGPAATLRVPRSTEAQEAADKDDAERLLRAIGAWMASPGAVPGGGAWQESVAASIRSASPHAPGRAPLAMDAAARALDALWKQLEQNAGRPPMGKRQPSNVHDVAACVKLAVSATFDTAMGLLRLDGRFKKQESTPAGMRGGLGKAGSPKGMPGDIPPLM